MFEQFKAKRKEERFKAKMSNFYNAHPECEWFSNGLVEGGIIGDDDITNCSNEELVEKIKNWYVYKEIKSLRQVEDQPGEEYIRYWEKCIKNNEYPDNKGGYEKAFGSMLSDEDNRSYLASYVLTALKADADFWYEKDDSLKKDTVPYATLYKATKKGLGNIEVILEWGLIADTYNFFRGNNGYIKFARAILKAYYSNGNSQLFEKTMKRLTYVETISSTNRFYHDSGVPITIGSILGVRFNIINEQRDDHLYGAFNRKIKFDLLEPSLFYTSKSYFKGFIGRPAIDFVGPIAEAVIIYILLNNEYWNGLDSDKEDEIWKYIDKLNVQAYQQAEELRSREFDEFRREEAEKKNKML